MQDWFDPNIDVTDRFSPSIDIRKWLDPNIDVTDRFLLRIPTAGQVGVAQVGESQVGS